MRRASVLATSWLLLLLAGLPLAACGRPGSRVGSETNFLTSCEASCGAGLTCICGTCTRSCSAASDCTDLSARAACIDESTRPTGTICRSAPSAARCDEECRADEDCAQLGSNYVCRGGYCRDESTPPECRPSLSAGDNQVSIDIGGKTRSYIVRVPRAAAGGASPPLVLDFHTLGGSPATEQASSGYSELGDRAGVVVAWPKGEDAAWNVGPCCTDSRDVDDVGFARAIVEQLQETACIDPKRVYAVGIAIGGGLAYQLACNAADVFAAVAPSAFDLLESSEQPCAPSRPLTVMSFRGTADDVVPYEGGAVQSPTDPSVTIHLLGAQGTFQRWAELNGCAGVPSVADSNGCSTHTSCTNGVEVTLCTTENGGIAYGSADLAWSTLQRFGLP